MKEVERRLSKVKTTYDGTTEWVPVALLEHEARCQRRFQKARADAIAAAFDPDALGKPLVCVITTPAGRERWVTIDGQHRVEAVKIALGEDQKIECEVIRSVTIERAAQLFRERNNSRRPRPIDLYLTGVTAKDPECIGIDKTVKGLGLHIAERQESRSVCAVSTLQKLYRHDAHREVDGQSPLVRRTLQSAVEAWGPEPDSFIGDLLGGMGLVLRRYDGALDREVLIHKLKGARGGALGLLGRSRSLREAEGGSITLCVARAIVGLYNSGRRRGNLLPPLTDRRDDDVPEPARVAGGE